ncbi:MAG: lipoyl(octanoyl) transferase LipB [Desulfobacterales bacterium]
MPYPQALVLQRNLVGAKIKGEFTPDTWLILEHPPVYTLGRRGGRQNLTVSEEFLEAKRIPIIHVERGGDITYHGPGQIVGYPIIDLRRARLGVRDYVEKLEALMLRSAAHWRVSARRDPRNRGIWVGDKKIGSIGIHVRRGIAFHGFAFNVNPSLTPFAWINPCGLKGVGVTSLAAEGAGNLDLAAVGRVMQREAAHLFGITFKAQESRELFAHPALRRLEMSPPATPAGASCPS